ncbi:MAG: PrgI family protein [Anaerolineales bacterium]|nr:MAG: PrgI family protein [Anaerolineales bacterium]
MAYSVSTPRRFDFRTKLWGLSLRQWTYVGVGAAVAGLLMLGVQVPIVARILLGLIVMAPAAAMAFIKYHGLPLDQTLIALLRYRGGTRQRVWRRGFGEYLISTGVAEAEAPAVAIDRPAVVATFIVLVNAAVLVGLAVFVWYFVTDGYSELQGWLSRMRW